MNVVLMVVCFQILPILVGVIWPILAFRRWRAGKSRTITVLSGTAQTLFSNDWNGAYSLTMDTADGSHSLALNRKLFLHGRVLPHVCPIAAGAVTYKDTVTALALGNSLYYHSALLPRLLGFGWELVMAPVASVAYSGFIAGALGLIQYSLGFDGSGVSIKFNAHGVGLLVWILLWAGMVAAYFCWYRWRKGRFVADVESHFPTLMAYGEQQPASVAAQDEGVPQAVSAMP